MNRRHLLSTLSSIAVCALPVSLRRAAYAATGEGWTSLSSPPLKRGATRIRIPVDQGRAFLSGLKLGVDGNRLMIRKILLHRGPRSLTILDVNKVLEPGHQSEPIYLADAPYLVRSIGLEYEALPGRASETVIRMWITG